MKHRTRCRKTSRKQQTRRKQPQKGGAVFEFEIEVDGTIIENDPYVHLQAYSLASLFTNVVKFVTERGFSDPNIIKMQTAEPFTLRSNGRELRNDYLGLMVHVDLKSIDAGYINNATGRVIFTPFTPTEMETITFASPSSTSLHKPLLIRAIRKCMPSLSSEMIDRSADLIISWYSEKEIQNLYIDRKKLKRSVSDAIRVLDERATKSLTKSAPSIDVKPNVYALLGHGCINKIDKYITEPDKIIWIELSTCGLFGYTSNYNVLENPTVRSFFLNTPMPKTLEEKDTYKAKFKQLTKLSYDVKFPGDKVADGNNTLVLNFPAQGYVKKSGIIQLYEKADKVISEEIFKKTTFPITDQTILDWMYSSSIYPKIGDFPLTSVTEFQTYKASLNLSYDALFQSIQYEPKKYGIEIPTSGHTVIIQAGCRSVCGGKESYSHPGRTHSGRMAIKFLKRVPAVATNTNSKGMTYLLTYLNNGLLKEANEHLDDICLKGYKVAKDYVSRRVTLQYGNRNLPFTSAYELAIKKRDEIGTTSNFGRLEEKDRPLINLIIDKINSILTSKNEKEFNESVIKKYGLVKGKANIEAAARREAEEAPVLAAAEAKRLENEELLKDRDGVLRNLLKEPYSVMMKDGRKSETYSTFYRAARHISDYLRENYTIVANERIRVGGVYFVQPNFTSNELFLVQVQSISDTKSKRIEGTCLILSKTSPVIGGIGKRPEPGEPKVTSFVLDDLQNYLSTTPIFYESKIVPPSPAKSWFSSLFSSSKRKTTRKHRKTN